LAVESSRISRHAAVGHAQDKKKILPCCAFLEGEYGIKGLFVGVPVNLGRRGVEAILELKLSADETAALQRSAAAAKELIDKLKL